VSHEQQRRARARPRGSGAGYAVPTSDRAGVWGGAPREKVTEFDGHAVESPEDLLDLLLGDRVGRAVPVKILRGGEKKTLNVTVGERP